MPQSYRHIKDYENKILKLREQGKTRKEICEKFGFSIKQYENFINRYNTNQRKLEAGIALRKKGRPPKDYVVRKEDKVAEYYYCATL